MENLQKYFVIKYELKESSAIMHGSIWPVTPAAYPQGFVIFPFLGVVFPTPGHAKSENFPPLSIWSTSYMLRVIFFLGKFNFSLGTIFLPQVILHHNRAI